MLNDKYRPIKFEEVVGQGKIAEILRNQVTSGKIAHAYLFEGNRGSGKTTMARIIAKAINCEHPQNGNPCGECPSCKSIANQSNLDVIEIDAASNNGVDTIRDITSNMKYSPNGKFKIYIIDEVHMLSKSAFNAFLKTLEEPPKYGVFILCTTEKENIPVTVISRCQQYKFKNIDSKIIESHIKQIALKENFNSPDLDNIANLISVICDGAMRDAICLLEQTITSNLSFNQLIELTGFTGNTQIVGLVESILYKKSVNYLFELGDINIPNIVEKMVKIFRDMVCFRKFGVNALKGTSSEIEGIKMLENKYTKVPTSILMDIIRNISLKYNDISNSKFKWTLLEMTLIEIEDILEINGMSNVFSIPANLMSNYNKGKSQDNIPQNSQNCNTIPQQNINEIAQQDINEIPQQSVNDTHKENIAEEQLNLEKNEIKAPTVTSQAIENRKYKMISMLYQCKGKFDLLAKELENADFIKVAEENKILILATQSEHIVESMKNIKINQAMNQFFKIEGVQYELVIE